MRPRYIALASVRLSFDLYSSTLETMMHYDMAFHFMSDFEA